MEGGRWRKKEGRTGEGGRWWEKGGREGGSRKGGIGEEGRE